MREKKSFLLLASVLLAAATLSCQLVSNILATGGSEPAANPSPAVTLPPAEIESSPTPPSPPASSPEATAPQPTELLPPTAPAPAAEICPAGICFEAGSFHLARPVGAGGRNIIDHSNRFGEFRKSTGKAHYGVDFLNSTGTPVVAAAEGVVIVAGDDSQVAYGPPPNSYGNLVIIKHELPGINQAVFTLYAHLSQVFVSVDERVTTGQEIGLVGMSGRVTGSTLHFEVRLGENTRAAVRNPELWLLPLPDDNGQSTGALAGRVVDGRGNYLRVSNILIERLEVGDQSRSANVYLKTYADKRLFGLDPWRENFAVGGLPAGKYQVSFWLKGLQQQVVEVKSGKLTIINFVVK